MSAIGYVGRLGGTRLKLKLPANARLLLLGTVTAAVVATALAGGLASDRHVRWTDFAVLAMAGSFAQLFATRVGGNQAFHTGVAFAFAAALVLPPGLVVLVCVVQHLPDWLWHRWRWYVQTFNVANYALSGLAAWSVRDAFAGFGYDAARGTGASSVLAAAVAGVAFVVVNHALLAWMLQLARGHDVKASGLFSLDGLVADGGLASVGIGVAFALLYAPALVVVVAVPLVLIQRVLAMPTLRAQAMTDHKTGLLNSRGIDQPARNEFVRAQRLGRAMSVLICDIDDMRGINNRFGHLQGDAALAAVAESFRMELRPYDVCARFGGDEFLVVLPETEQRDAVAVASRIQAWLATHPIETKHGPFEVGLSIGAASLRDDEPQIGSVIGRADAAMYIAKRAGRTSFLTVG